MKCSLCGFEFKKESAKSSCNGCFLAKNCELTRCPNCGFEMVPEFKWGKKIKKQEKKNDDFNG